MASIHSVNVALPPHRLVKSELPLVAHTWLQEDEQARERFLRLAQNAGVAGRNLILPYEKILEIKGLEERTRIFEKCGHELLTKVIEESLKGYKDDPKTIGTLVFTSCSVPTIPSLDARVISATPLSSSISRIPIYQQGCAGGVFGLALGAKLADCRKPVLVSSLELCSLVFQPHNRSGEHLVGAAIFGDGAAATIILPGEGEIIFVDSQSHLIPESFHLMGYNIFDDGFHLRLDRGLPSALANYAPLIVKSFLEKNGLAINEVQHWLFHPGGKRILEYLQDSFSLKDEQFHCSVDVLRDYGNLSSATIHFVLKQFLDEKKIGSGEHALIVGIGPGLTIELVLLRAQD